jgi:ADP-ribosyl-[dinitrogen reductase] hydrolase
MQGSSNRVDGPLADCPGLLKLGRKGRLVSVLDKVKGALYGLAIGDALGGTTEFMSKAEIERVYGRVTEIIGGGCWQLEPGETTDDTAMTIAVAKGILTNPDNPIPHIGEEFLAWAQSGPKDIGNIVRCAIRAYRGNWFEAAERAHEESGGLSAGNGSLMRCLPVALAYPDKGRMEEITAVQSKMTHFDPLADEACLIYNRIANRMLNGEKLRDAMRTEVQDTRYAAALDREPSVPPSGYVLHTLLWVVHILNTSPDFESAVQFAANLGGDADTIGAIAGGLAGLECGFAALPKRYVEKILVGAELDLLAEQLVQLYTGARPRSDRPNQ